MPAQLTFKQVLLIALVGFVVYFPIAVYLKNSYVPQPPAPRKLWLTGPFIQLAPAGAAFIASLPQMDLLADSEQQPFQSTILLYENGRLLGPPHTSHPEIIFFGDGRYSHWKGQGLIFSASDSSDPNQNFKVYSVEVSLPQP